MSLLGVRSSSDYPQLLQEMDEAVDKQHVTESRRMDEEELKAVIKKAILKSHTNHTGGGHGPGHSGGAHGGHGHGHGGRLLMAIRHFFASVGDSVADCCRRSSGKVGHYGDSDKDHDDNAFTEAELKEMMNTSFKPLVVNKPRANSNSSAAAAADGGNGNGNGNNGDDKEQKVDGSGSGREGKSRNCW